MMHEQLADSHLIDACVWQTQFDSEQEAVDLQNVLSQWSRTELSSIAEQVFESRCPELETWRIDRLEIDLGEIEIDELMIALPRKFKQALNASLSEFLSRSQRNDYLYRTDESTGKSASPLDTLRHFLLFGVLPWWERRALSPSEILDDHIEEKPELLAAMLRLIGKKESVRKRMAMQWQESRIRRVIGVLEPEQHDYILEFADELTSYGEQGQLNQARGADFKQNLWLWIFGHLLVERGTLFNTVMFVRSTLESLAKHYNMAFAQVFDAVYQAARQLTSANNNQPRFMQALRIIDSQIDSSKQNPDWQKTDFLSAEASKDLFSRDLDLFVQLLHANPEKACGLVVKSANPDHIRKLATDLGRSELNTLLHILSPPLAEPLLDFAARLRALAVTNTESLMHVFWTKLITELVGKQWQQDNLATLMKRIAGALVSSRRVNQLDLTSSLTESLLSKPNSKSIALGTTLHQLKLEDRKKPAQENTPSGDWSRRVMEYLEGENLSGQLAPASNHEELRKLRWHFLSHGARLVTQLRKRGSERKHLGLLSENLLNLAGSYGYSDLLFKLSSPLNKQILELEALLLWSRSNGYLSSWQNLEFLPLFRRLCVQTLVSNPKPVAIGQFLQVFCLVLANETTIGRSPWLLDLGKILSLPQHPQVSPDIAQWLHKQVLIPPAHMKEPEGNYKHSKAGLQLQRIESRRLLRLFLDEGSMALFRESAIRSERQYINDLLDNDPEEFRRFLREEPISASATYRLLLLLDSASLWRALSATLQNRRSELARLHSLYQWFEKQQIPGLARHDLELFMAEQLFILWTSSSWKSGLILQHMGLISGFAYQQSYIPPEGIRRTLQKSISDAAPDIQEILKAELDPALKQVTGSMETGNKPDQLAIIPDTEDHSSSIEPGKSISINNAGLVLIGGFIETYFQRLGLVKNGQFANEDRQQDAIHCLQYLVTGMESTEEYFLLLNKLLCGVALNEPISAGVNFTEEQHHLANSLIEALIDHWPELGGSSIDGFRGNWLVREGALVEQEENWTLLVEKRAYDILLQRSPFSYSVTNFPWMKKPLFTTWV